MNKRFILKSIISLYQSFNLLTKNDSYYMNTNKVTEINKWFEMSYSNIHNLAILSHKVYSELEFNNTSDISRDKDTVRAYLFSSEDNKTHIISIKGTTTMFGKNMNIYNSIYNDKFNDNLYYSCCFYKESNLFNKIDELNDEKCWNENESFSRFKKQIIFNRNSNLCKEKCFKAMNKNKLNYISISYEIIEKLKQIKESDINFEKDEILFTGHSLGGSLATVMGVIFNKPAISFQSPGIKNFLEKSDILKEYVDNFDINNIENIYNFGHNADIIFTGKCNGKLSFCYLGGYNIETKCHIGKVCEYDSINKLNISESIFTHKLTYVLDNIIPKWENDFPECKIKKCNDCEDWEYIK